MFCFYPLGISIIYRLLRSNICKVLKFEFFPYTIRNIYLIFIFMKNLIFMARCFLKFWVTTCYIAISWYVMFFDFFANHITVLFFPSTPAGSDLEHIYHWVDKASLSIKSFNSLRVLILFKTEP